MKRKAITLFLTMAVAVSAVGCGRANNNKNNTGTVNNTENQGVGILGSESVIESTELEADFNQLQLGNALELPEGFDGTEGETDAHGELEEIIAKHLNIEEKNYKDFRYYYNYVDLNGDSKNEILAMVLGEGLNDQGGNHLLWIDASGDNLSEDSIMQEFRGVSAPVYISNHMTEGYRDLILCNNIGINNNATPGAAGVDEETENITEGGGTTENNTADGTDNNSGYVLLVWDGSKYQELEEGTVLEDLQGYEGNAVITNDLERDYREDTYHFLGEAMNL
ncbi:MAG: hypothetical protein NC307_00060 [Roseburia sp.]|nr:hypothetical protein [Roseburia sp.]